MQASFHQEQQCQQLQQQAAGLIGRVQMLSGRCEDAEADVQALRQRLSLEAERVSASNNAPQSKDDCSAPWDPSV